MPNKVQTGSLRPTPTAKSSLQAVMYARVSSREQEQEGFSIPAQQKLLYEYASRHQFIVVQEYIDIETAKQTGRTHFQAMVTYLKAHPSVQYLLVEKTDRLYRNFRDFVLLEELDREIHLVKEGEILSKQSKSHSKFIHGIKVLMAKNYIDNLSEEVMKGMREKCEQGGYPGKAPVGYRHNLEHHTVEVDSDKAPVIQDLYERYATGQDSLADLRHYCLSIGFTTRRSERRISLSHIERILKNRFYTGQFEWNGHLYQGNHPPIVSLDLFNRVQDAFQRHHHPKGRRGRTFAFRGLLTCGRCGCAITAERKKERYTYYRCTGFKGRCGESPLREEALQAKLGHIVKGIHIDGEMVEWIQEALTVHQAESTACEAQQMHTLETRQAKLQAWIDQSYQHFLEGKITEQYWLAKTRDWQVELAHVQKELTERQQVRKDALFTAQKILELANKAYSLYVQQSPQEQRRLLNVLLSNCTLLDGSLCPTYKKPFDLLVERVKNKEWLGDQESNLGS